MGSVSRRDILKTGTALAAVVPAGAVLAGPAWAESVCTEAAIFSREMRPRLRWWWPGGAIDPAEVRREVNQLADAGFGGFEIADVRDSQEVPTDPKTQGWASPAWIAGVEAALEVAAERGLEADITLGAHWPTGVPGVMPDDDAASKELVHGEARITGRTRYNDLVPPPLQAKPSGALKENNDNPPSTPKLVSLQAFRVTVGENGKTVALDTGSRVDLTAKVRDGRIDWTPPGKGEWRLLAFWMRGTGQIQNMFDRNKKASMLADPRPYVIDIYGKAAAEALTGYWDRHLLPARTRELMRKVGGSFFEDSLEVSAACNWSPDLLGEFSRRRGYDLQPYLALLPTARGGMPGEGGASLYALVGVDTARLRHDFDRTLSEMYNDYRVKAIGEWAHGLGMKFRVQVVGSNVNSGLAATYADIPEGDNSNDIHGWQAFAAGRDIGGRKILSDEAATFVGGSAHVATWRDMLYMLQRDYAGGVNSVVIHGFSYADGPGATWPGFSAFGAAIGNDWGPRDPNWAVVNDVTSYLARVQGLLQTGRAVADIAVINRSLKSVALRRAGYTWQYPALELLEHPAMKVQDKVLMAEGPAYRALVFNKVDAIDPVTADRLVDYARAGLPIIFVGALPQRGRGWGDAAAQDARIRARMSELLAFANVAQVAKASELAAALARLEVAPSLGFSGDERLLAVRRLAGDDNYYYLLNDDKGAVTSRIALEGQGTPYRIDPWSGEISQITGWARKGKQVLFDLTLAKDEVVLLRVGAVEAGCVTSRPRVWSAAVPAPVSPTSWTLQVEDWLRGTSATETIKRSYETSLATLRPWSAIEPIKSSSGVGRYRTVIKLPVWGKGLGAWLDLGKVGGTPRLFVNGHQLPPVNLFTNRVDVGPWLRRGSNLIEVVVATPLNNRLKAEGVESSFGPPAGEGGDGAAIAFPTAPQPANSEPDEYDGPVGGMGAQVGGGQPGGKRKLQDYGLMGPVKLTPFTY